ncbi:MAG: hypothetical protein ACTS3F_13390 [Phycisphaerales bacterium]
MWRSLLVAMVLVAVMVCGGGSAWGAIWEGDGTGDGGGGDGAAAREPGGDAEDGEVGDDGAEEAAREAALATGAAYRALFARLPEDLEALNQAPSGRGLDSWVLFEDHAGLLGISEELAALTERAGCDFGTGASVDPAPAHLAGARRGMHLLLHRAMRELLGDRERSAGSVGEGAGDADGAGAGAGVDRAAAVRFARAAMNLAEHVAQRGNFAERAFAADAAPTLLGLVRRSPERMSWAVESLKGSRYLPALEGLFGYRGAGIARLRGLALLAEREPARFAELTGLMEPGGDASDARVMAAVARERQVLEMCAEVLEGSWTSDESAGVVRPLIAQMRSLPREARVAREVLNELVRKAAEIAAVRDDVRAVLEVEAGDAGAMPEAGPVEAPRPSRGGDGERGRGPE